MLITADGYLFNGTTHDRRAASFELATALPTLEATVVVEHVGLAWPESGHPGLTVPWEDAATRTEDLSFASVPFDHPLWVVFSSGTTGLPKGIVHGHGGVLLEHLKMLGLHTDLGTGDRLLWYTTTHWMMWNLVVSTLLTGATTCTYDGSPAPQARPDVLWELAARHKVTVFGTSPQYLLAMAKLGIEPFVHDLSAVRVIGCTGSALPASAYPWVRDHVGAGVQLASTSGGTDIVSGFAGSAATTPVWAGELSAPAWAWRWPPTTRRAPLSSTRSANWSSPGPCHPCRCTSGTTPTAAATATPTSAPTPVCGGTATGSRSRRTAR